MNNLFTYATKELSQDAMFCWLVNWLNYPESKLYPLGVCVMNLFLGKKQLPKYFNVKVVRQFNKIDVLILFNDSYALILEDKTNTSEHTKQIDRYKIALEEDENVKLNKSDIFTAYAKTGIWYDADIKTDENTDAKSQVTLQKLLDVLTPFAKQNVSEILSDYVAYLQGLLDDRNNINKELDCNNYSKALETRYGQFSFLDKIFDKRSKGRKIGNTYVKRDDNPPIIIDSIYAGTNKDGSPWTKYCFWGQQYKKQPSYENLNSKGQSPLKIEYHYLFWRIDCNWGKLEKESESTPVYYLALRHYDGNAHTKNEEKNERKRKVYAVLREAADRISTDNEFCQKIGKRENYKESDLIFIPVQNLQKTGDFDKIKSFLLEATAIMADAAKNVEQY